jgi:hypothetical protein
VGVGPQARGDKLRPVRIAASASGLREGGGVMTLALAARANSVRAAAGLSYAGENQLNLGALVYFPLHESWFDLPPLMLFHRALKLHATPGVGLAVLNISLGRQYVYGYDYRDNCLGRYAGPRTARLHLSLDAGLDWQIRPQDNVRLLALSGAIADEDQLIDDRAYPYQNKQPLFEDIHPFHDLILARANDRVSRARGVEVGLLDMVAFRWGSYEPQQSSAPESRPSTMNGFGLKLRGLANLIRWLPGVNRTTDRPLADNPVDIQWSRAYWHTRRSIYTFQGTYPTPKTQIFDQVTVSLRL